jgi:integrase
MAKVLQRMAYGKRGEGCLVLFDDSANWVSVYSHHGKEHRESTKTSDLKAAKKAHKVTLDKIAAEGLGHEAHVPVAQRKVTVNELLDAYEAHIQLRELKSAANQRYHVAPVREAFGDWRATAVTEKAITTVIKQWQAEKKANATINRRLQCLLAAFKRGQAAKQVTEIPNITWLPERNVRTGFFEDAEVEKVLKHLPDYLTDLARFAFFTAWRPSAIKGLKWDAVDLKDGTIRLPDSKNGQPVFIPIAGPLVDIMKRRAQARLATRPDGEPVIAEHVFHRNGKAIKCYRGSWDKAVEVAGFTAQVKGADGKVRTKNLKLFYDMKRSAVRNLTRTPGVSESVAMSIAGIKTRSIFDRYNITSTADQEKALEAVGARSKVKAGR